MRPIRVLLLLALLAPPLCALDIPPKPTAWVTDNAGILSPSEEQSLNEKLETLKQRNGAEILIMTFPSLEGEDVTDYTNRVAEMWKVKDDRALMLFVFPNDRKMWIQVGYGLEGDIPDAIASRVYRETLVPRFRANDYYGGINEAVDQLIKRIDPNFITTTSPATTTLPPRRAQPEPQASGIDLGFILFIALIFLFFILPMLTRGRRRGGCGGCIFPFFFGGGGPGITFGGGGSSWGGGGGGFNVGGSWGGGGSSFGGGGAGGGW